MATNIGPKIGVDGEAEYRKQINNIIQQAKTLSSEMKAVTASFDENTSAAKKAQESAKVLSKQIETQKEKVNALTAMLEKSSEKFGENDTRTLKWKQAVNDANAELYKMESELKKANAVIDASKTSANNASSAFQKVKNSLYLLTTEGKTNKQIISSMKAEYDAMKANVVNMTRELESATNEYGKNSEEANELAANLREAKEEMNGMAAEIKELKSQSTKLGSAFSSIGSAAGGVAKSAITGLGSVIKTGFKGAVNVGIKSVKAFGTAVAAMGTAAASGILALGKIGLDYNSEMEQYTTNFEVMLGSQEAAVAKVEALKEMAASTPFEMAGLADATQQLLAMNVASEDTEKYITQLGDISLGNSEKFNSLVNAFGKMNSTGKVTLEYINMMAEQGFNPLNVIAQQTGETMTQLYDRLSKGNVTLDEVKNAMEIATSEGGQFAGGMEKASHTIKGLIATLEDNAKSLVGEVFQPISDGLKDTVLPGAINAVDELTEAFRENGVEGMIDAAGEMIGDALGEFTAALPKFVSSAGSIVKSLLTGIQNNQSEISRGAVETIKTLIDGLIDMLPEILVTGVLLLGELAAGLAQAIPDLIAQIPVIVQEIVNAFKNHSDQIARIGDDIVSGIKTGISNAWNGLVSWFNGIWNSLFGSRSVNVNVNKSSSSSRSIDGSHASGLSYVPFNGYIAELHKGEMVLTKAQADAIRNAEYMYIPRRSSGGQSTGTSATTHNYGGQTFNIYQQAGESTEELAERLMEIMQTQVIKKEAALGG